MKKYFQKPFRWTEDKRQYISDNYKSKSDKQIAKDVQKMLEKELGAEQAAQYKITPKAVCEQRSAMKLYRFHPCIKYSKNEIEYIKKNWTKTDQELHAAIQAMRTDPIQKAALTISAVRAKRTKLGLVKRDVVGCVKVTDKMVQHILQHYKEKGNLWLAKEFNELFPRPKKKGIWTPAQILALMKRRKIRRTAEEVRHVQAKQIEHGIKIAKGGYKAAEINTLTTWQLGYKDGKPHKLQFVMTEDGWRQYKRVLWEKYHGPLKRGQDIKVIDGNEENIVIENLKMIEHSALLHKGFGELSDSWILGCIAKGNPELRAILKDCPDIIDLYRNSRIIIRALKNT